MWIRAIVLSLCVVSLFGADADAVKKEVQTLIDNADQERASGDFQKAEKTYQAAIQKCDLLPPSDVHSKTDVLRKLGNLYANMADPDRAEMIFKERIAILASHERPGGPPDLDLGIALFDLQITLEGANLTNTRETRKLKNTSIKR